MVTSYATCLHKEVHISWTICAFGDSNTRFSAVRRLADRLIGTLGKELNEIQ